MLAKLLILVLIIGLVWFLFKSKKNKNEKIELVECKKCGTFISSKSIKNGLIKNEIQAVIANANCINFLACESLELAKSLQELANDYLFDSKIALLISNDDELLKAITARIDAVIYKNIL